MVPKRLIDNSAEVQGYLVILWKELINATLVVLLDCYIPFYGGLGVTTEF